MSIEELVTGTFEIHVFVAPLDPSSALVDAFTAACQADSDAPRMKSLLLYLDYVDRGFVGVLQTSRYVTGTLAEARRHGESDAALLREAGFDVVREKIEAIATNEGVPQTESDAARSPSDRYFEFHLLVASKNGPISNDEVASLRDIASAMAAKLGRPVPLSYNALKPSQRFLNLRTRGVGLDESMKYVHELGESLERTGFLEVKKVIAEYVCWDTNRAVDDGWLEPLPTAASRSN